MRQETIERDEVAIGSEIVLSLMPDGNRGQGGTVQTITDTDVTMVCGTDKHVLTFAWADVHHITIEVPLDADECLEFGSDCQGAVDYHTTGSSLRAWPRCEFHADKRQESYENSLERYATSDVAPSWFDETAIGERWEADY